MKNEVLRINPFATKENSVESYVSFKKFADFLQERIKKDHSPRVRFFQYVLDRINVHPELLAGIPVIDASNYSEVLELVASVVFPLIEDEDKVMFGLTNGISPEVFYASNAFHRLHQSRPDIRGEGGDEAWLGTENALQLHQQTQYDLILQKVYGLELPQKKRNTAQLLQPHYRLVPIFQGEH